MAKIIWMCMECGREQPDQELQCQCGNIDPILFEEKDIYHEQVDAEVKTMVEETPTEEVTTLVDDMPADEDEEKDKPIDTTRMTDECPSPEEAEAERAGARGRWRR